MPKNRARRASSGSSASEKPKNKKQINPLKEKLEVQAQKMTSQRMIKKFLRLVLLMFVFHQFVTFMNGDQKNNSRNERGVFTQINPQTGESHKTTAPLVAPSHVKLGVVNPEVPNQMRFNGIDPNAEDGNHKISVADVRRNPALLKQIEKNLMNRDPELARKMAAQEDQLQNLPIGEFANQQEMLDEIFKYEDEHSDDKKNDDDLGDLVPLKSYDDMIAEMTGKSSEKVQIKEFENQHKITDFEKNLGSAARPELIKMQENINEVKLVNEQAKLAFEKQNDEIRGSNEKISLEDLDKLSDENLSDEERMLQDLINKHGQEDEEEDDNFPGSNDSNRDETDYYDDGSKKPQWLIDEEHGIKDKWILAKHGKKTYHVLNTNYLGNRGSLASKLADSEAFTKTLTAGGKGHHSNRIHFGGDKTYHSALKSREDFENLNLDLSTDRFAEEGFANNDGSMSQRQFERRQEKVKAKEARIAERRAAKNSKARGQFRSRMAKINSRASSEPGIPAVSNLPNLGVPTAEPTARPVFLAANSENYLAQLQDFKAKQREERRKKKHGQKGVYAVDTQKDMFAGDLTKFKSDNEAGDEELHENLVPEEHDEDYLPNEDFSCPKWDLDYSQEVEPMINLDRNKFISPVLPYGPNNQLRGFREAVWLAIRLNRTLVVPPFFKHDRTDAAETTGKGSIIPPDHRLSVNALRKLIPVIAPQDMGLYCDNEDSFDVFFLARKKYCSTNKMTRINNMISWMGLTPTNFIAKSKQCNIDRPVLPLDPEILPPKGPVRLSANQPPQTFYQSRATCALWVFPYHTVGFTKVLDYDLNVDFQDLRDNPEKYPGWWEGDISVMSAIIQHTPRPKYIQDLAADITSNLFGEDQLYLAMHWRYDKGDWAVHCDRASVLTAAKTAACNVVLNAIDHPEMVAEKMTTWIKSLMNQQIDIRGLYIAAPLDSQELMDAIKDSVEKGIPNFKVATGSDSWPIFEKAYEGCEYFEENGHDVFSLIDMEICTNSFIFLRSGGSSWSLNVSQERHVHGVDSEDFENMNLLGVSGVGEDDEE